MCARQQASDADCFFMYRRTLRSSCGFQHLSVRLGSGLEVNRLKVDVTTGENNNTL